jgi:hypothetical protein
MVAAPLLLSGDTGVGLGFFAEGPALRASRCGCAAAAGIFCGGPCPPRLPLRLRRMFG